MRLYYAPGTCALACWIALEWSEVEYSVEKVDPRSDKYRAINPLGMVPAIDIGLKQPKTQADAILHYIAERYPEKKLGADDDMEARFEFNEIMSFLTGDFHPAFWPYFVPQRFTISQSDDALIAVREAAYPRVTRVLDHLNTLLASTGHVYRGRRSVADAYAFVMTRWTEKFPNSWKNYEYISGFMERMSVDPSVQHVLTQSNL